MIAYASRTGTRQTLAALRQAGWHLLVSAAGVQRTEGFPYALDNGAWSAYQRGTAFDDAAFVQALQSLGRHAEWVVLPDIVMGGIASLALSLAWEARVLAVAPYALLPVQNGMELHHIAQVLASSPRLGLFVGGDTPWKERTMASWGALGRALGRIVHVGRVNTARRIHLCAHAGVTSFDGSSVARFRCTLRLLDVARKQLPLFVEEASTCHRHA